LAGFRQIFCRQSCEKFFVAYLRKAGSQHGVIYPITSMLVVLMTEEILCV
jgi:hypothetical protein